LQDTVGKWGRFLPRHATLIGDAADGESVRIGEGKGRIEMGIEYGNRDLAIGPSGSLRGDVEDKAQPSVHLFDRERFAGAEGKGGALAGHLGVVAVMLEFGYIVQADFIEALLIQFPVFI